MTVIAPPPTAPSAPQPPSGAPRVVSRVFTIIGAVLAVVVVVVGIAAGWPRDRFVSTQTSADVQGVTNLNVELGAGDIAIVFSDEAEGAVLNVREGETFWNITVEGDTLHVRPDRIASWPGIFSREGQLTLTLPRALEGIDADFEVDAGSLAVTGSFGTVELDVNAGDASFEGSAKRIETSVDAGSATLDLADVTASKLDVSAGSITARFTGTAPRDIQLEVDAGKADIVVPDEVYRLVREGDFGDVDVTALRTSPTAERSITIDSEFGSATIRPQS